MSSATQRWRRTRHELKAASVPIVAFWAMTALGWAALFVLYLIDQGADDGVWVFVALGVCTFVGIGAGQLAALFRVRTWVVALTCLGIWSLVFVAIYIEPIVGDDIAIVLALLLVLGPLFAMAGLWSLRVHMGLLATWAPLVYLTGCILVISQEFTGSANNWFEGSKWAIWDLFSLPILLLGTGFLLVYLAARERHRVQLWRFAKAGPDLPEKAFELKKRGGLSCGGLAAGVALTLVLGGATAVTAPYLWRSAPADQGDNDTKVQPQPQPQPDEPEESGGCNDSQTEEEEGDTGEGEGGGEQTTEQVVEAVKQAGISLMTLILVLLMAIVGLLVFIPPMRRNMLLRHLRKPLWPVPPTRQVLQAWRVIEIALADIGVHRRPGDSAESLAQRAIDALPPDVDHTGLLRCAHLADRVLFGLGVESTDPEEARRTAEMTYQAVWELLGEGARLRAVYRLV